MQGFNPNDPIDVARDILSRISAYDSTAPAPSATVLSQWADMIDRAKVPYDFLADAVITVYYHGGEPPKNKLGAVIEAGRAGRRDARAGAVVAELTPPSFDDDAVGPTGYAIPSAYMVDGVMGMVCDHCGATLGEHCTQDGKVKKIPHTERLQIAYRTNNEKGRRDYAARQMHLAKHKRDYVPSWKAAPAKK